MQKLQLVYAPNAIFRKKALPVEEVNDRVRALIDQMFEVLHIENGRGLGANMVGLYWTEKFGQKFRWYSFSIR